MNVHSDRQLPTSFSRLPLSPYATALRILYALDMGIQDKSDDALNSFFEGNAVSKQGEGLARMLVNESLRWRVTLIAHIKTLTKKRYKDIAAPLRQLLLLGLCSVLHPDERAKDRGHAHVNAWVEVAKSLKLTNGQQGLLNACLRKAEGLPALGDAPENAKGSLNELSQQYGWPLWAVEELKKHLGAQAQRIKTKGDLSTTVEMTDWLKASHQHRGLGVMHVPSLNPESTPELNETLTQLKNSGLTLTQPYPDTPAYFYCENGISGGPATLPDFEKGAWYVQDYGSAWVALEAARHLDGHECPVVVDLCAAPGSKSWILSKALPAGGELHAVDVSSKRLELLHENIERLNLNKDQIHVHTSDALEWVLPNDQLADLVLVDAPCSALGTLRHHADLWLHRNPESMKQYPTLQKKMLSHATTLVKPDGTLVYSTCTWWPAENERVIQAFLQVHPDWECIEQKHLPLTPQHDAFFLAVLKPSLNP